MAVCCRYIFVDLLVIGEFCPIWRIIVASSAVDTGTKWRFQDWCGCSNISAAFCPSFLATSASINTLSYCSDPTIWIQGNVHLIQWNKNQSLTKFFDVDHARCDKMSTSNHGLVGPSNPATTPHPSTPSKSRGGSNASHGPPTPRRDQSPSFRTPPSTPSWGISRSNALLPTPATTRQRKDNAQLRLHGIKTRIPGNLSLDSICTCLIAKLSLLYTPDDWQVHLIWCIFQGYNSIFCAGTGYGKSLVFEGLAVLGGAGKLVIVISPLKALERDQVVCYLLSNFQSLNLCGRQSKPQQRVLKS